MRVALIEKYPTNFDYSQYFKTVNVERFALVNKKQAKVLVKDVTLEIDEELYDYIILVGAEPLKMVAKRSGITDLQGHVVGDKYIPLVNPAMLAFKPEAQPGIEKAVVAINKILVGDVLEEVFTDCKGIQNTQEIMTELRSAFSECKDGLTVDTETSSLYPREGYILGISLTWKDGQGIYFDCNYITEEVESALQMLFDKFVCVFHNAKFDIKWLQYHFGFKFPRFEDTMLLHYALDERTGTHGLKSLAMKFTKHGDYERELDIFKEKYCREHKVKKMDFSYDLIPFDIICVYAAMDTLVTRELYQLFMPMVKADAKLLNVYTRLLKPGTLMLMQLEENGVPFSAERLGLAKQKLDKDILALEEELYTFKEVKQLEASLEKQFNPNSTAQLRTLFFDMLGLRPIKKTDTGAWSTDAETLEALSEDHPIPAMVSKIRKLKKIRSTYIEKILVGVDSDFRLRTGFNLTTTTSGRLSSSGKLNMQQLPRDNKMPKWSIKAEEGCTIVSGDLGTAEMYTVAADALAADRNLQKVFVDKQDYHGSMAIHKFGLPCTPNEVATLFPKERQEAKTVSFEILYKLNMREEVLKKFPTLKKWLVARSNEVKQNGFLYSYFGRKRRLRNIQSSDNQVVQHEVRSAINFLVQSTASDITLLGAIDLMNWINANGYQKKMRMFALVHDSILAEVHDDVLGLYKEKLVHFLQKDRGLNFQGTPIKVDIEEGADYSFTGKTDIEDL